MRRERIIVLLSLMMWATATAEEAPRAVREPIVALTRSLFDALGTGQRDVWERTLADDAIVIDEFGRRQTKADIVKGIRPLPEGFSGSIEIRDPHVRQYGDTAVIDCENYERETVHGQKLVVRYLSTLMFVRRSRAWKLAALHTVTLPTAPPPLSVPDLHLDGYPGTYRWGPDRANLVSVSNGQLVYSTRPGGPTTRLDPIARDVFMDAGEERNLYIFCRGADGRIEELIERRKFNDLHMKLQPAQ